MKPSMIVQGELTHAKYLLQQLLVADLPVDCVIMAEHTTDTPEYQALITASALCPQFSLRMGTAADYAQATWLVLTDLEEPLPALADRIVALRRLTNRILENGFRGQLVFTGQDDEVLTYFAWKYSGAAIGQIWGLGTYPVNQLLTYRLADRLGVGVNAIQTTVVGRAAEPVVAWSRTYVGPTPILMYLANADAAFNAEDLDKMESWLRREATGSQTALRYLTLIHLFQALLANQPVIAPVAHPQPGETALAVATPVLVTLQGTQAITNLALSEDEQRAYSAETTAIHETITQLEGTPTEGR